MKKTQMKILLAKLVRWYPKGFPAGMSTAEMTARCDDFFEVLGEYNYETVNEAINALVKTKTFLPSASEILEAVQAIEDREAAEKDAEIPTEFTDADGYSYKRIDGQIVCVDRPNKRPLKDAELRAWMDERRRLYAEVGAPKTYTMEQVRQMAARKKMVIEEQEDMAMLARILGGRQ